MVIFFGPKYPVVILKSDFAIAPGDHITSASVEEARLLPPLAEALAPIRDSGLPREARTAALTSATCGRQTTDRNGVPDFVFVLAFAGRVSI